MTNANMTQRASIVHGDVERIQGQDAQSANFSAGQALSEAIRTTLGPKSMDKMLISADGNVIVTNDGASILDRMEIDHPAAEMVVRVAETQEDATGDGTTTAVILTGELLRNAADLIDRGLHPTTITEGYQLAAVRAIETLREAAIDIDVDDSDRLQDIARTVITGKWDDADSRFLAGLAVDAVRAIERDGTVDRKKITRQAVTGGSPRDSEVVDGLIIDMESSSTSMVGPETAFPRRIRDATIALIDDQLTIETVTGLGTVNLDDPEQHRALLRYEDQIYEEYVATLAGVDADVVFCQKSIDEPIQYLLARQGILAVERTRRDELIKLKRATGAQPAASINQLTITDTGYAGAVKRRRVGAQELAVVTDCRDADQVSILLRGGTSHVIDEMKRILDDCLDALKQAVENRSVLPGGGATEVMLAAELRNYANGVGGREQLAIEAFADASEAIPRTLAENAGVDPIDTLIELRNRHNEGSPTVGFDVMNGAAADMVAVGVLEPLAIKRCAIASAREAATMLIRVDDVVAVSRERDADEEEHEHGSETLHASTEGYPWAVGHPMGG